MKSTTEYHWSFQNVGNPEDTEVGLGGWPTMCMALAKWLARVNMNSEVRIKYGRKPMIPGAIENNADDALAAMFASIAAESDALDGEV